MWIQRRSSGNCRRTDSQSSATGGAAGLSTSRPLEYATPDPSKAMPESRSRRRMVPPARARPCPGRIAVLPKRPFHRQPTLSGGGVQPCANQIQSKPLSPAWRLLGGCAARSPHRPGGRCPFGRGAILRIVGRCRVLPRRKLVEAAGIERVEVTRGRADWLGDAEGSCSGAIGRRRFTSVLIHHTQQVPVQSADGASRGSRPGRTDKSTAIHDSWSA